jgi:ketosteroid isomerase-like protein
MRFAVIILLLHHFLTGFAQTGSEQKILQTELRRFDAMTRKDTMALQKFLADDLIYIHSNSLKENKKEHISAIATGKTVYEKMSRENARIRKYGKTAVINGNVKVNGILNKTPFEINLLYTAIYRKHKKQWQLISWQSTRIP